MSNPQNIKYSLKEYITNKDEFLSFDELEEFIEEREKELNNQEFNIGNDNYSEIFFVLEQEYNDNFTKKELDHIAEYYDISKRKKKKSELIQDIIIFEQNDLNFDIVERRKLHWFYIEQLIEDKYLKQFIMINK
ncbi:MAG: hypothetical protein CXT73_07270 [Methanobacteriota archaeon]|nr:MAG: hypothetical protein CXT73_07270 [Euryarchaeota archaeon]